MIRDVCLARMTLNLSPATELPKLEIDKLLIGKVYLGKDKIE